MGNAGFRAFFEGIAKLLSALCVLLLVGIIAINTLEIVLRTFFDRSLYWITETNVMLASSMYFLGIAVIYHRSQDVSASVVIDRLPPRVQKVYLRAIDLLSGVVYLIVAWFTWKLVQLQWPFHTPGVGFPRIAYTMPLLVGLGVIALECLWRAITGVSTAVPAGEQEPIA